MELARLADLLSDGSGHRKVAKYLRLSDGIAAAVETGELEPGERLPGETELANALPASLGTVQKALGWLAEQGVIVRRHGAGTFVAEKRSQLDDVWHFRFLDDHGSLLPIYTRVTAIRPVRDDGPWAAFLGPEDEYLRIDRRIDVNREFTAIGRIFLSMERFGELARSRPRSLENVNIRTVLRQRFGATTHRLVEQVGAETLPADICRTLALAPETCGLVCHALGYGRRDRPLTYQLIYVPPNTRRLEFRAQRP